eukprot:PhM_4_TR8320/c0_g2_i2/m.21730
MPSSVMHCEAEKKRQSTRWSGPGFHPTPPSIRFARNPRYGVAGERQLHCEAEKEDNRLVGTVLGSTQRPPVSGSLATLGMALLVSASCIAKQKKKTIDSLERS